jgi:tetratricopeptide (TPR) repeat protein
LTRDSPGIPAYRDDAAFIHEHLGTMFVALGKTEEAEEELQRAIDIRRALCREHKAAEYQWRLAATLVLCPVPPLCDSAEAIELARQAVQQSPRNAVFAATLGAASYRAGDWKSSLDSLREASVMDRAGVQRYRFFAAMARHRLGNSDEAVTTLEEAIAWRTQNCPGSPDLQRLEAEAVQLIRRPNEKSGPQ